MTQRPILPLVILTFLVASNAVADYTWSWAIGCPESGTSSPASTFSTSNNHGFSGSGSCQRITSGFTRFDYSIYNSTPNYTTFFGHHTGDFLFLPPMWEWDRKPIVLSQAACPTEGKSLNWLVGMWRQEYESGLTGLPVFGSATYSTGSGIQIDMGYDIEGTTQTIGPISLGGSCSGGLLSLSGFGDRAGTVQFNYTGSAQFATESGKRHFIVPQTAVTLSTDLGSRTFKGYSFDSQTAVNSRPIQVTSNSAGSTWTITPYLDPAAGSIDDAYVDSIAISVTNSPSNGMLRGTLTRTDAGMATGKVVCIVGKGVGVRVYCTAESPDDNNIPMAFAFSSEGPHVLGKASGTSALTDISFSTPEGAYSDGTHLIIADTNNNRVLIWNSMPSSNQSTPDIVLGQPDFSSVSANNGGRTAHSLNGPRAVWSDGTRLIVADSSNHRVLIWNEFPTTSAEDADVVVGQNAFTTASWGTTSQRFYQPYSIATDGTKLAVADYTNNRILIFNTIPTANNAIADVVLGQPDFTSSTANNGGISATTISAVTGVSIAAGKLFATDYNNNRVLIWNSIPTATQAAADVVLGQSNFSSSTANSGGVSSSSLRAPRGVFSDGTKLYVADRTNNRILVWNTIPTSNMAAANNVIGQSSFSGVTANSGGRSGATLYYPRSMATDGTRLFVVDSGNHRVLQWETIPTTNQPIADFVQGQPDMTTGSANIGTASEYTLNSPQHAFSDGTRLFAADASGHRVLIWNSIPKNNYTAADIVLGQPDFTTATANSGGISAASLDSPAGVFFDGTKLYVADGNNSRVLIWNSLPSANFTAADVVLGQPDFVSSTQNNGGRTSQSLASPTSVHVHGGKLYVADRLNNRVLIWNSIPTVNQTAADVVLGQPNFTSGTANNGGISAQTLYGPRDATIDGTRLFVADTSNNRVLIWNSVPTTTQAAADLVLGQPDFISNTADNGGRSAATLSGPVSVQSNGSKLFVSDANPSRVLGWNAIPTANQTAANFVFGQPDFVSGTANNGGLSSSRLSSPRHIHILNQSVLVADSTNNRILAFELP